MLEKILEDHALWFRTQGREGERAVLHGVDLAHAVLKRATLVEADMTGASFDHADLSEADCRGANFFDSSFKSACLAGANCDEVDMTFADLTEADLTGTRLRGAYLQGADLSHSRGLKREQIADAFIDEMTQLPDFSSP